MQGIAREEKQYCRNVKGKFGESSEEDAEKFREMGERCGKVPGMRESCEKNARKFWESSKKVAEM